MIKTSGNSSELKDQVFWYKAEAHSDFKVGHPKFWKYHSINYNTDYENQADKDQMEFDKIKQKYAKTKKLKVIVSRQGDILDYDPEDTEE